LKKTALRSGIVPPPRPSSNLSLSDLMFHAQSWLYDGEARQHSSQIISVRRHVLDKLHWLLVKRGYTACGTQEIRAFLAYTSSGHLEPGGRWGNPHLTQPVRPRTVKDYHAHLRTFFRWLIAQRVLAESPMEMIAAPVSRADQIQPFSEAQVNALLAAARRSRHPLRDEAIMLFLLDTGVRASELCGLRQKDVDLQEQRCVVLGKGNKHRVSHFGRDTRRALFNYLRDEVKDPDAALFRSDRGETAGEALTRWGLRQIIERAGQAAKIEATRCSPHTFRHTMAVTWLRNGGQVFALKELLGHTDLKMTNRYVALAQADVANQHRRFSPADSLKKR